jgi:hypothetical protein
VLVNASLFFISDIVGFPYIALKIDYDVLVVVYFSFSYSYTVHAGPLNTCRYIKVLSALKMCQF